MVQGLTFVSDLKLGHYTKIPPRAMFLCQIIGTVIGGFVNLATARWLMETIPNICTAAAFPFTCNSASTFYSASVIWGAVGPAKMFAGSSPYSAMLYFFLIGLVLPIPFYFLAKRYPNSWVRYIHIPLIFNATGMMPPAVPLNFSMWCAGGFVFMYWIRKYRHDWWTPVSPLLVLSSLVSAWELLPMICHTVGHQPGGVMTKTTRTIVHWQA
jgi:OPT family oligopeptide transporter